jgi:hypothetical protein
MEPYPSATAARAAKKNPIAPDSRKEKPIKQAKTARHTFQASLSSE